MANDINIRIGAKLDGLQRELKKAQGQLTRFADFAENVGSALTTRLSLPIVGVGAAAVTSFAKFERLELSLKALAEQGEDTGETMARLQEIAKLPGIGLEQAIQGAAQLRTVGFEARQAEEILKGLAKATTLSGGGPEQLQSVVRQITQINSKGRILQEDLGIILENVPSIGIALQDAFGTTNVEAIRATGVSTQQFTAEIIKAISANEKFSKAQGGLANDLENFGLSIRLTLAELGRTIATSIDLSGILQTLSGWVSRVSQAFQELSPSAQKAIVVTAAIAAAIGPVILALGATVKTLAALRVSIALVGGAMKAALLSPLGLVVAAIAVFAAGIFTAYKRSETFRSTIAKIGADLKSTFSPIVAGVITVFGKLSSSLSDNSDTFRKFLAVVTGVMTAAAEYVSIFFEGIRAGFEGFSLLLDGEFRAAGKKFGEAITKINPVGVAITEGRRLGEAYSKAYNNALNYTEIENPETPSGPVADIDLGSVFSSFGTDVSNISDTGEKIARDFQGVVQPLVSSAAIPLVEQTTNITRALDKAIEKAPVFRDSFVEAALAIKDSFADIASNGLSRLGSELENIAEQGKLSFKTFAQAAVSAITEVIGALIKQGVAAAVANAFKNPAGVIPPVGLALAGLAGAGASALFKSLISKIAPPKLAAGGIIPPGFEGDRFPAMLNSGEAVIPLQKLFNFLEGQGGNGEFVLRGQDLYLAMDRASRAYNRTGG